MGEVGEGREKLRRIRVKKERTKSRDRFQDWTRFGPELALALLLIGAVLFLLNPFTGAVAAWEPGPWRQIAQIFTDRGVSLVLGGGLFLFAVVLGIQRIHWRIRNYRGLWKTRCPQCASKDLRRTPRLWYHRLLGKLGLPVRRYICADCHWRGGRIDQTRL